MLVLSINGELFDRNTPVCIILYISRTLYNFHFVHILLRWLDTPKHYQRDE